MENLIMLLTASLVLYRSSRQFKTTHIADTGCTVWYSPEAEFEFTCTDEGDGLYFAEHKDKEITYGVLCATLKDPLSLEESQEIMRIYLNRLRGPFNCLYNTGALAPESPASFIGLEDYWQDCDGLDWKVKACTNGKTIAVLFVKNIANVDVARHDRFFDSFSFGK